MAMAWGEIPSGTIPSWSRSRVFEQFNNNLNFDYQHVASIQNDCLLSHYVTQQMDLFDKFFEKDGSKCLMLFLQDGDAPNHGELFWCAIISFNWVLDYLYFCIPF